MKIIKGAETSRLAFFTKAADACTSFSVDMSTHFRVQKQALINTEELSLLKKDDRTCFKCGALGFLNDVKNGLTARNFKFLVNPKPKTSKTVIRCLQKWNTTLTGSYSLTDQITSSYQRRVLSHYFHRSSKVVRVCRTCGERTSANGEKRSDQSFVDRHSIQFKKRRQARKKTAELKLAADPLSRKPSTSSSSGYTTMSTLNQYSDSCSLSTTSNVSLSVPKNTKSPMQTFKTSSMSRDNSSLVKPTITQERVTNKNSSAIIRKFQQNHIKKLMKSEDSKKKQSINKASDLNKFLQSLK